MLYTLAAALYAAFNALCFSLAGPEGLLFAAIAPVTLADKGIIKQWRSLSQDAYWLSLFKSAFSDPMYTGTTKSRRSIKPREDILGAPFVEYYDLQNRKGDRLTDTIHIPPFDGDEEVLFGSGDDAGYIRVKGQNRVGYEIQADRKNIDFCLQTYFFSAFEEDINMSEQELGGELLPLLIEHLTTTGGRIMDASKLVTIFLNYSPHVYSRIAQADDTISNGDAVGASTDLGVPAPFEHPNTFAFINNSDLSTPDYELAAANDSASTTWGEKVQDVVSKVNTNALPGRKMLDLIMYQIKKLRIVPIRYMNVDGLGSESMYIYLVSPALMNMLLDDPDLQKRFDNAFSGHMYKHPLINEKDKIYRQLIVREVEKLDQDLYTYDRNYGEAVADGAAGGVGTADAVTYVKSGSGRDTRISLTIPTGRTFEAATPAAADTAIGATGGAKIDRSILLGASAVGCVPGPVFPLDRRQEDDYGNILGLGQERLGADRRVDFPTSRAHASGYDNQGSMVIAAYNGK